MITFASKPVGKKLLILSTLTVLVFSFDVFLIKNSQTSLNTPVGTIRTQDSKSLASRENNAENNQAGKAVLGTSDLNSVSINVRDFGAVGDGITDDTASIQDALNSAAGRSVFVPKGRYIISSTLTYVTNRAGWTDGPTIFGEGRYNTIFDNRVSNGFMLSIRSDHRYDFQLGGKLEGFSIITSTNPANSSGIELQAIWQYEIKNIRIEGLSGDGITITSRENDPDSSNFIQISNVFILRNGGYGINSNFAPSTNGHGNFRVTNSNINSNKAGGIKHNGLTSYFGNNSISYNQGTGGIYVPYNGIQAQNMVIEQNEFDGNIPNQVNVEAIFGLKLNMNQVSLNPLSSYGTLIPNLPTEGFRFGQGVDTIYGQVRNVHAFLNRFRIDESANPFTAFVVGGNAHNVRILDTTWHIFGAAGQTKFGDYGHDTTIDDAYSIREDYIRGDINLDGKVDIFDYNILFGNFGKSQ